MSEKAKVAVAKKVAAPKKSAPKAVEKKEAVVKEEKKVAPKVVVKKEKGLPTPKVVQDPQNRGMRKTRIGKVVSDKMDKTCVVLIVEKKPHPLYKKTVTRSKKFKVHDENNECGIGDTIEIMETRPLSKDKYFRLVKIIEKAK